MTYCNIPEYAFDQCRRGRGQGILAPVIYFTLKIAWPWTRKIVFGLGLDILTSADAKVLASKLNETEKHEIVMPDV